ncbi:MAG: hypothetical protein ABL886_00850 [Rhodoglobus sp.]
MALTASDRLFLTRWKGIDFTAWNEAEVREGFVIDLLHTLGYRKGTTYDLEMEKPLKLSEPFHRIGRQKVDIDYAPSVRKRYFWIVEAKPGKSKAMDAGDLLQVHLYAVHPEVQARLVVLVNGWQIRVYDALTMTTFDKPLLILDQPGTDDSFAEMKDMLGAERMLEFQRKRLLDIVQETLVTEVDVDAVSALSVQLRKLEADAKKVVEANARQLWTSSRKKFDEEEEAELRGLSLSVLQVRMDLPNDGRPVSAREFVRRVVDGDEAERRRLVDWLVMQCRARPHSIFRVLALQALLDLADKGVSVPRSTYVTSMVASINELTQANISYWAFSDLANALCHLDNAAMRIAMKLCLRVGQPFFEELLSAWKGAMTAAEKVVRAPSLESLVSSTAGHVQEILWRWYCSEASATAVWDGIWNLHAIEAELDKLPPLAAHGEILDFHGWEFIGQSHDQLRTGTWNVLKRRRTLLAAEEIDQRVRDFAGKTHEAIRAEMPTELRAPPGWKRRRTSADANEIFTKALVTRVVATLGQHGAPAKG